MSEPVWIVVVGLVAMLVVIGAGAAVQRIAPAVARTRDTVLRAAPDRARTPASSERHAAAPARPAPTDPRARAAARVEVAAG